MARLELLFALLAIGLGVALAADANCPCKQHYRVSVAEACARYKRNELHTLGCTQFVASLLGKHYCHTSHYCVGNNVGNGPYSGLVPGQIIGWQNSKYDGHVAVWLGPNSGCYNPQGRQCVIVDSPGPGQRTSCLTFGFGANRPVYKMFYPCNTNACKCGYVNGQAPPSCGK